MNYYNYFTEIEEHFVRRRGKHMYISPLDWSLIATWKESGIPLHVAIRGIDIAMDGFFSKPHRFGSKVSTLLYCHDSIMEEFSRFLEAHVGESPNSTEESQDAAADNNAAADKDAAANKFAAAKFISERIEEIERLRAKHCLGETDAEEIPRILERLREILGDLQQETKVNLESLERDLGILEELLISNLSAKVPPEAMASWEEEAKRELKIYKKKVPKETFEKIKRNYLRSKIHGLFQVRELSVIQL
jgi:hypothetical protein